MLFGYARVSTAGQTLDAQTDALTAAGVDKIYSDKASGSSRNRPKLSELLGVLREGDVVVVTKFDRLARSVKDLLDLIQTITKSGAGFRSLAEEIDTTTAAGRLQLHVFASIAEFERERIVERTKEGLAAARKRGRVGGRPRALTPAQAAEAVRMVVEDGRSQGETARLFKCSPATIMRLVRRQTE